MLPKIFKTLCIGIFFNKDQYYLKLHFIVIKFGFRILMDIYEGMVQYYSHK